MGNFTKRVGQLAEHHSDFGLTRLVKKENFMNKFAFFSLIVLLAIMLGSCAKATTQPSELKSEPMEEMINPGDRIGDFLITTGDNESVTYLANTHCPLDQNTGIKSCEFPVDTKVNVSSSIYDDNLNSGKNLDEYWSEAEPTFEFLIGGRSVNLQAFGTIDITHSILGKMRQWNVVIVADKPGEITVKNSGVVGGDNFEYNFKMIFIAP